MCVYVPREGLTCAARRKSGEGYGSCVLTATRVQRGGGNWSPQRGLTCAETRKSGEGYGSCVLMGFRLQRTIPPPSSSKSSTSVLHPANLNQIITHLNGKFILLNSTAELLEKGAIGGEVGLSPMY